MCLLRKDVIRRWNSSLAREVDNNFKPRYVTTSSRGQVSKSVVSSNTDNSFCGISNIGRDVLFQFVNLTGLV